MNEQTEHPENQPEQASESQRFDPKRISIGCLILLIVFSGCGWGLLRLVSGLPDYDKMAGLLVAAAHLSTEFGTEGQVHLGEVIRNVPEPQRKEFVEEYVNELFAGGWHIRMTRNWNEYPENFDQDWHQNANTVRVIKRRMVEKLVEDSSSP